MIFPTFLITNEKKKRKKIDIIMMREVIFYEFVRAIGELKQISSPVIPRVALYARCTCTERKRANFQSERRKEPWKRRKRKNDRGRGEGKRKKEETEKRRKRDETKSERP